MDKKIWILLKIIINLGLIWFAFIYLAYGWIELDWNSNSIIEALFFYTARTFVTLITIILTVCVSLLLWDKNILEKAYKI